ncbi:MAG: hypothetical protein WKG01_23750 [Kofleriaceae bacterium]
MTAELRVYDDAGALVGCGRMADDRCAIAGTTLIKLRYKLTLAVRGPYRPVLFVGTGIPSSTGALAQDLAAPGVRTVTAARILVQ